MFVELQFANNAIRVFMTDRHGPTSPRARDDAFEIKLRPRRLADFIGQDKIKDNLRVFMQAALERSESLDHVLLSGPPGLGKCIAGSSRVMTPQGYVEMRELAPKDLCPGEFRPLEITVMGLNGPEKTSHVYASGYGPTLQIQTRRGFAIEGTPCHPLLVNTPNGPVWRRLDSIALGEELLVADTGYPRRLHTLQLEYVAVSEFDDRGRVSASRARPEEAALHPTANRSEPVLLDAVTQIHPSAAETFDFVVPGTHSFVANGLWNHNTTLGHIIANEMGASITTTSGPVLDKPAAIAGILTKLGESDVLFIDEIHRLPPNVEEYLYSAMEDYHIDIVIDSGPNARSVKLTLPPFTLVGATTRKGLLTAPLRARFGIDFRYDYYSAELLTKILMRSAGILQVKINAKGAVEIARRSRGTPRIANRLLRRTRDFAQVEGDGSITLQMADRALTALEVDQAGLDDMDARILLTIVDNFSGGPVGLGTLAVAVGEDAGTIEEVYEPYLIQEGYLQRTARGRIATPKAYKHFGRSNPKTPPDLFD